MMDPAAGVCIIPGQKEGQQTPDCAPSIFPSARFGAFSAAVCGVHPLNSSTT
jgi:hypothetical protein